MITGAPRGVFITIEGVDGAGKSTQLARLAEALRATRNDIVTTREPGGAPGAEEIRRLLVEGAPQRWSAHTELLLFTAARRDHVERTIRPALARGAIVLCDRYVDSTRAYQGARREGAGEGVALETVDALHALMIGLDPDLTLVLDIDPAQALARAQAPGRFEAMGLAFQQSLRAAFRAIAAAEPARCALIDAAADPDAVAARLHAVVADRIGL